MNSDASHNLTSITKGYMTYIWNKPIAPTCYCNYHVSRKGRASLYDISNNAIKHLRDEQYQLEYIINGSPETIYNFENSYTVRGSPDTFVRYYLAPPSKNNKANEYNFLISNDFTDYCFGKPIPDPKIIANPLIRMVKCGLGTPMDPTQILDQPERFKLTNKKLIPLSNSKLFFKCWL